MIKDYEKFIEHLKRTGRLKLLPAVLREVKAEAARKRQNAAKHETATENPALISGWRELKDGTLRDHSGKGALIEIYRRVTQ